MKTLMYLGEEYKAPFVIKGKDFIIGKNEEDVEVFKFQGVKDFTVFSLDSEYDLPQKDLEKNTEQDLNSALLALSDIYEQLMQTQLELEALKEDKTNG